MSHKIERSVIVKAPIKKVWEAISDYKNFGQWFQARIDQPFEEGKCSSGAMTIPGYEHLPFEIKVIQVVKEELLSFEWAPFINEKTDLSNEPWQLVEFKLESVSEGTRISITESGFEKISEKYREDARRGNEKGWEFQIKNLERYVTR